MKVVWDRGASTVRDVYELLRKKRKVAYTTVMTMMNILVDKKHLQKRESRRRLSLRADQTEEAGCRRNGAGLRRPGLRWVGASPCCCNWSRIGT